MLTVQLPIPFLKAMYDDPEMAKVWLKWLSLYGNRVQEPFFMATLEKNEKPGADLLQKYKRAYEFGRIYLMGIVFSKAKKQESKKRQALSEQYTEIAKKVLNYLNTKTGIEYGKTNPVPHLKPIIAILQSGYSQHDCITVIDKKYDEWEKDDVMKIYIRPSTLFKLDKFDNYLNQPIRNVKGSKPAGGSIESVSHSVREAIALNDEIRRNNGTAQPDQGN